MKSDYNNKLNKYIMYLDANNLYGSAMSQYLFCGEFKWLNQKESDKFDVNLIKEIISDGYILEIDLEYPDELHKLHNDYPLAPLLLNYCSSIANQYDIKIGGVNKLIANLGNKSKYVLHYKNCVCH